VIIPAIGKNQEQNYGAADSPPEIDPIAPQTPNSLGPLVTCFGVVIPDVTQLIVSEINRTEPSNKEILTPPGCLLAAEKTPHQSVLSLAHYAVK
jgi:hypothetical protein